MFSLSDKHWAEHFTHTSSSNPHKQPHEGCTSVPSFKRGNWESEIWNNLRSARSLQVIELGLEPTTFQIAFRVRCCVSSLLGPQLWLPWWLASTPVGSSSSPSSAQRQHPSIPPETQEFFLSPRHVVLHTFNLSPNPGFSFHYLSNERPLSTPSPVLIFGSCNHRLQERKDTAFVNENHLKHSQRTATSWKSPITAGGRKKKKHLITPFWKC